MSSGRHWGSSTAEEGPWRDVSGPGGWDRLVLPDRLIKLLKDARTLYIERVRLVRGAEPGPGEWLIFEGASGTGKSSAAQTLANQLRLPLLEADAANWTESLDDLFAPVAGRFAVLAIDHADAVLSGRADVAEQLGRWRRTLPSLVIVCVESRRSLPVAVLENFDHILMLPDPDVSARRELWRRALPADAPLAARDTDALAREFELTGKEIVSCAVAAESSSAKRQVPLTASVIADVVRAAFPGRDGHPASRPARGRIKDAFPRRDRDPPPRPARARPTPRFAVALAVVGAIAAATVGLAVSRHSSSSPTPLALDRQASVGPIHFSYPSQWGQARASVATLSPSVSLRSASGQLVLGLSQSPGGSGIPAAFGPNTDATQQLVALGSNRFYRIVALRTAGEDVYALPSPQGMVIAVCKTASTAFAQSCERVLATVAVTQPAATPDGSYPRALSMILARLNHVRTDLSAQLAQASDPSSQSRALQGLASAHGAVAGQVAALIAGGASDANRDLAVALNQAASAYSGLAQAAQHKDQSGYQAGQRSVDRANAAIRAALDELAARGYRIV